MTSTRREVHERAAKAEANIRFASQIQTELEYSVKPKKHRQERKKINQKLVFEKLDYNRQKLEEAYLGKIFFDDDEGVEETRIITEIVWFDGNLQGNEGDSQYVVSTELYPSSETNQEGQWIYILFNSTFIFMSLFPVETYAIDEELSRMIELKGSENDNRESHV